MAVWRFRQARLTKVLTAAHTSATYATTWGGNLWSPCVAICIAGRVCTSTRSIVKLLHCLKRNRPLYNQGVLVHCRWMQIQSHCRVCPVCKAGIDEDKVRKVFCMTKHCSKTRTSSSSALSIGHSHIWTRGASSRPS